MAPNELRVRVTFSLMLDTDAYLERFEPYPHGTQAKAAIREHVRLECERASRIHLERLGILMPEEG